MKSLFYNIILISLLLSCQHQHSSTQIAVVRALEILDQHQQQQQQLPPTNNVNEDERLLQQQTNNNNNVCLQSSTSTSTTSSSSKVINQVLSYLDQHRTQIESSIFIRYTNSHQNETLPSTSFTYKDFRTSLEWMATVGIPKDLSIEGGGDDNDDDEENTWKFYMGPDNCNNDGWHVGLANVATFLSQSMSLVILNDTCDELNWEQVFPNPLSTEGKYPLSNACGQRGISYTSSSTHTWCSSSSSTSKYQCNPQDTVPLKITAASKSLYEDENTPPPLKCFPRNAERTVTGYYDPTLGRVVNKEGDVLPSKAGRTDVEGCCYWGRGALHTKGVCNLGILNYYMGAGAARDGRNAKYPDVDFCTNPEAICNVEEDSRSMAMRWDVALFEWVMRVQSYNNDNLVDGGGGGANDLVGSDSKRWNYMEEITKFTTSGDLIDSIEFSGGQQSSHFIDEVGGILEQGCPYPPCKNGDDPLNRLHMRSQRKKNFLTSLNAIGLPVKSDLYRTTEEHFTTDSIMQSIVDTLLVSKSPVDGKMYQSSRYRHFNDFMESLRKMSDIGFDDTYFYIGQGEQSTNGDGITRLSNSGLLNIALFLTYAVDMSILDDACDEHNTQLINGRFPVSNSCGQYGESYQDIVCSANDAGMECPMDPNQSFSAVTSSFDLSAPQPFKCAPKTQYPVTGFWDEDQLEENHQTAYSNQIGRVDVEGCCWWGRGVLRHVTRGRCIFGQMNYYIGMRAAAEGRPSLYPQIDFCKFPEAICASEYSNELRWVSGMFHWTKNVQSYNEGGWSYMDNIQKLASEVFQNGKLDTEVITAVDCLVRKGSHNCDSAENMTDQLNGVLSLISIFSLPTTSPTATISPSASPKDLPTVTPTDVPTDSPTATNPPTASPNILSYPSRDDVEQMLRIIADKQASIKSKLLTPRQSIDDKKIYSFEGFLSSLRVLASGTVQGGIYFYIGHDVARDRAYRKRGMVNVAAFLSHVKTVAVYDSVCDEQNVDNINKKFPLSNACGQNGLNYQNMRCSPDESFMECPPDPGLQMKAVAPLVSSEVQPPPFFCGPRMYFPSTGYYDAEYNVVRNQEPFANRAGRTDVQSCCFWGRGAAQIKGACLYGKLNYHIGARAKEEGRRSLFPNTDFCLNPQAICSGPYSYSLMWISGMFTWIEVVQSHPVYSDALENYVADEIGDEEFIDAVSDILGSNVVERRTMRSNFNLAVDAVGLKQFR